MATREYLELELGLVEPDPDQPRKDINPETLTELADSIRAMGVEQPINVRNHPHKPGHFMIISGERRWRACSVAGMTRIPAILREEMEIDDIRRRQLAENYHRDNFNPVEEAEFLNRWIEGLKSDQVDSPNTIVANALGMSLPTLSKKLSVLKFDAEVRALVRDGIIRDNAALRALNKLPVGDRKLVIEKAKVGNFNFKDFQTNSRRVLKELRDAKKGVVKPRQLETKTLARWHITAEIAKKLMAETEFYSHIKEHDLNQVDDITLMQIFEKFKKWLDER